MQPPARDLSARARLACQLPPVTAPARLTLFRTADKRLYRGKLDPSRRLRSVRLAQCLAPVVPGNCASTLRDRPLRGLSPEKRFSGTDPFGVRPCNRERR